MLYLPLRKAKGPNGLKCPCLEVWRGEFLHQKCARKRRFSRGRFHKVLGFFRRYFPPKKKWKVFEELLWNLLLYTLQGTNMSHLGKRKIIFKCDFWEGYVSFHYGKLSKRWKKTKSTSLRMFFRAFKVIPTNGSLQGKTPHLMKHRRPQKNPPALLMEELE